MFTLMVGGGGIQYESFVLEQIPIGGYIISIFAPLNQQSKILVSHLLKSKKLCPPNIGMWGVYPEAMGCNVGVLCSDINLVEHILR